MRDSASRWFIVRKAKIFSTFLNSGWCKKMQNLNSFAQTSFFKLLKHIS